MSTTRFILQPSQDPGFWVATDKENGIVVKFREHQFNETQQVTLLDGDTFSSTEKALKVATYLRELSDWLRDNHYNKVMPSVSIRIIIGDRIRQFRTARNLSQQQLADMAGITKANVCNIEAGKYSVGIDILHRVCEALGAEIQINSKYQ